MSGLKKFVHIADMSVALALGPPSKITVVFLMPVVPLVHQTVRGLANFPIPYNGRERLHIHFHMGVLPQGTVSRT